MSSQDSSGVRILKDITFGSIAGIASKIFEHPFDLAKVRLQSQVLSTSPSPRFAGPIDCLNQTWRSEGIRGLYRGLPAPVVGAMAENATMFLGYRTCQQIIRSATGNMGELSLPQLAIAGGGAGVLTSFVLTPVELVKCRMQVQMLAPSYLLAPPPGPLSVLSSIVRHTGFRGLWLGQTGTLLREAGGGAAWFATKEYVARLLVDRRVPPPSSVSESGVIHTQEPLLLWESAFSGACAGALYNLSIFPAYSVKSTIQTAAELHPGAPPMSFVQTVKAMYRAGGIRGFYAGCGITVARAGPSSAIIFLVYDGLNKYFG